MNGKYLNSPKSWFHSVILLGQTWTDNLNTITLWFLPYGLRSFSAITGFGYSEATGYSRRYSWSFPISCRSQWATSWTLNFFRLFLRRLFWNSQTEFASRCSIGSWIGSRIFSGYHLGFFDYSQCTSAPEIGSSIGIFGCLPAGLGPGLGLSVFLGPAHLSRKG